MGRSVTVAITDGALDFGPWEQIFYGFPYRSPIDISPEDIARFAA